MLERVRRFCRKQSQKLLLAQRSLLNIRRKEARHLIPKFLAVNDLRQPLDDCGDFRGIPGSVIVAHFVAYELLVQFRALLLEPMQVGFT